MSQLKKSDFSERVRDYRTRTGLSQDELGSRLGVSGNYIYQIESKKKSPGESLMKLFDSIEQSELSGSEEKTDKVITPEQANSFTWMQTSTLLRSIQDCASRLDRVQPNELKHLVGNLLSLTEELENRINSGIVSDAARAAKQGADSLDGDQSK